MSLTLRLDAANVEHAADAGDAWYTAARAVWESEPSNPHPQIPARVRELEAAYQKALALCSEAGQVLVAFFLFDQPLPGDLCARIEEGERLSTEELLEEVYRAMEDDSVSEWSGADYEDRVCTTCKEPFVSAPGLARWLCGMCFKHTLVHERRCDETRENCCCGRVLLYVAEKGENKAHLEMVRNH